MRAKLACLALGLMPVLSYAAQASDASVRKLMEVTQVQAQANQIVQQMSASINANLQQRLAQQTLTADQRKQTQKILSDFSQQLTALVAQEVTGPAYMQDVANVYRETFTQAEIDSLIAFYQTPTGRLVIEKMPVVSQKTAALTMQRLPQLQQKAQVLAQQTAQKLQAAVPTLK
ncbi:Uncharacterized protein conserved in bacteria [Bordetella ansorpii]|uniref:Uncharacterized protein conserved in bacteria n=1 Tax=Bordetella ansorpii TaxID=288768 RepID=A0A157SWQ6_9BORD|nr:DUF2059 domain-containing protein [Bordetella ansorpii]SAI74725.1 Uncharacterized protein conserved in bacteria [Bordetella ansorpii]